MARINLSFALGKEGVLAIKKCSELESPSDNFKVILQIKLPFPSAHGRDACTQFTLAGFSLDGARVSENA